MNNVQKGKRYTAQRSRNLYDPSCSKQFKLSRTKLDLFLNCPRCFYIDRKLGTDRPPDNQLSLNLAVDILLKREFDIYRKAQMPHPICAENNLNVVPFKHDHIEDWQNPLYAGIQYEVPGTNITLYGGLDDVWIDQATKELIVVDYKAISKNADDITYYPIGYRRQVEIYQWLLKKNGFNVSNIAYFVYCNSIINKYFFNNRLEFNVSLAPYHADSSWVDDAVKQAYDCLQKDVIPPFTPSCDYCQYTQKIQHHTLEK